MNRSYSFLDRLLMSFDIGLKTLTQHAIAMRDNPAMHLSEDELSDQERKQSAAFMRINHAGEIAAQALYQGQALVAQSERVKTNLLQAALEENDHLHWCRQRIQELQSHTSYLDPFWYTGSFAIGVMAGLAGDHWSLGFLAETERQVENHLQNHLDKLSHQDTKSRAIVQQMKIDEIQHAATALQAGAYELPVVIKYGMSLMAKIMTTTAYWV